MVTAQIEDSLIKEVFEYSQQAVLTPANLGIFQRGTKKDIIDVLEQVDINQLINFESRKEYDEWFDDIVMQFHKALFPSYRDNLVITVDNPYSYSARLLTQYLKYLSTRTIVYCTAPEELISMIHPIISNTYLNSYPELEIKMVNQIKNREQYYDVVDHYRLRLDLDLCELNKAILDMDFGIDV